MAHHQHLRNTIKDGNTKTLPNNQPKTISEGNIPHSDHCSKLFLFGQQLLTIAGVKKLTGLCKGIRMAEDFGISLPYYPMSHSH
eukprot:15340963-Ditylum_brightwellii.AAC.1